VIGRNRPRIRDGRRGTRGPDQVPRAPLASRTHQGATERCPYHSDMLDAIFEGLIGGLIGGAIARRRERKKAEQRQTEFAAGADVKMHCSLRWPMDSRSWSHGILRLSPNAATWRARLNRGEPLDLSPRSASWIDLRPVGTGDGLHTSMAMAIAVLNAGGRRLELAVLAKDVTLLRKIFGQPGTDDPVPPHALPDRRSGEEPA